MIGTSDGFKIKTRWKEARDLRQGRGHGVRRRTIRGFSSPPLARSNPPHFWKRPNQRSQHQGTRTFEMFLKALEEDHATLTIEENLDFS